MTSGFSGRRLRFRALAAWLGLVAVVSHCVHTHAASLRFVENNALDSEYGQQLVLPPGFGEGEFTLELWVRLDTSSPTGPTDVDARGQRRNWSNSDNPPYSGADWWWPGNFLLDGQNNHRFSEGSFSLQFYGGGRLRWNFGDGAPKTGGQWTVEAYPADSAPTLLDDRWHHIACVRRWTDGNSANLELWIDGELVAAEVSNRRTDMWANYWSEWAGFPLHQEGWFWGSEKQAAIGLLPQYEDYKGLLDEVRFWSRAKTVPELEMNWVAPVTGLEPGLVGWYSFYESAGTSTCSVLNAEECIDLFNADPSIWNPEEAPVGEVPILRTPAAPVTMPVRPSLPPRRDDPPAGEVRMPEAPPLVPEPHPAAEPVYPTAPVDVVSTLASHDSIQLAWIDAQDETGYTIERSDAGAEFKLIATLGADATSYADYSLAPDTPYEYRIRAFSADGESEFSNVAFGRTSNAPPAAPAALSCNPVRTLLSQSVVIVWADASNTEDGFMIERSSTGEIWTPLTVTGPNVATFEDDQVWPDRTYRYRVRAYNESGFSDYSAIAQVRTN